MDSAWIIGALAMMTIGGVLAISIFHFGYHLKDPKNLEAAKRVAADRESAATRVASDGVKGRSLRQRLDAAPGIDDRLGRETGLGPLDVILTSTWSDMRSTLKGRG